MLSTTSKLTPRYGNFADFAADWSLPSPNGSLVVLIRHGQSLCNQLHLKQGDVYSPLTENGSAQAGSASLVLADVVFDSALVSPSTRTTQTAKYILNDRIVPVTFDDNLIERRPGILDGLPTRMKSKNFHKLAQAMQRKPEAYAKDLGVSVKDLQKMLVDYFAAKQKREDYFAQIHTTEEEYLAMLRQQDPLSATPYLGESVLMTSARTMALKQEQLDPLANTSTLIIGHGYFFGLLILNLLGIRVDMDQIQQLKIGNTSITAFYKPNGSTDYELLLLNNGDHLPDLVGYDSDDF